MKQVLSDYSGEHKSIYILPIGDMHIGSKAFRQEYVDQALMFAKKHRNRCRIILMGDLLENATKTSVGKGVYDEEYPTQKQYENAVKIFKPYADLIDGIVIGNHEMRIVKDTSFEILEEFAHRIGVHDKYLGFEGMVNFALGDMTYSAHVWHGASGGATEGGAVNALLKMRDRSISHIYLMGHTHKLMSLKRSVNLPARGSDETRLMEMTFVNTGSSLGDEGYASMKGLSSMPLGFGVIEVFRDKRKTVFHRLDDLI